MSIPARTAALLTCAMTVTSSIALADEAPAHTMAGDLFLGWGRMVSRADTQNRERSSTNGGLALAFALSYRSPYFLAPFLEGGYSSIYQNEQSFITVEGQEAMSQNRLRGLFLVGGPGVEFWRMRVRAGIGVTNLMVSSKVLGQTLSSHELDMTYSAAVAGALIRQPRFQVGLEGRLLMIIEGQTWVGTLGLTVGADFLRW